MKRILLSSFLLAAVLNMPSFPAEVKFPEYSGYCNDYIKIIGPEYTAKINALANEVEENTGTQIAVAAIRSAYPLDSKSYAVQLFEKWGIGKKGKDNGILILFVKKDRRVEIEVGYGLEGVITDGYAGSVLDKYALPEFKNENYGKGIYMTALALADRIMKEYGSKPHTKFEQVNLNLYSIFLAVSVIMFVFFLVLLGRTWIGSLISGVLGAVIGYFLAGIAGIFIGFLVGLVISTGGYYGGYGGWGGGFGGGSTGGGFGGFGGGRSGGGGAGRSF